MNFARSWLTPQIVPVYIGTMTTRNAADLAAIETKLADTEALIEANARKGRSTADLQVQHDELIAAWVNLSAQLGRLAA